MDKMSKKSIGILNLVSDIFTDFAGKSKKLKLYLKNVKCAANCRRWWGCNLTTFRSAGTSCIHTALERCPRKSISAIPWQINSFWKALDFGLVAVFGNKQIERITKSLLKLKHFICSIKLVTTKVIYTKY